MSVTKEEIAEIKNKVNIVDVIGQYVPLTKKGQDYWGLCPFHADKHPSFSVSEKRGLYHCWSGSCGKAGDVIRFLEDYKNLDFQSALKEIAEMAGIVINLDQNVEKKGNPNAGLYEINNQASYLYESYLMLTEQGKPARKYLKEREIDEGLMKYFNLGLAPDLPDFLYKNLGSKFEEKALATVGLFNFSKSQTFDTFQNRLIFPIHNQYGQVVGFSGRIWQNGDSRQGKYVNTATTPIFEKSEVLYNLHRARKAIMKTKEVYLMEGYMDVIAAYKAGIENVLAIMGTALTQKHIQQISKFAKKIILITDGDKAGQTAIRKGLQQIKNLEVQVVVIPESMDPDEYGKKYGPEALAHLMNGSRVSRVEYLMDSMRPSNVTTIPNQLEFMQEMSPIIAEEKDRELQKTYIRRLSEILPDFDEKQVTNVVRQVPINQGFSQEPLRSADWSGNLDKVNQLQTEAVRKVTRSEYIERELLYLMIKRPELIERLSEVLNIKFHNKKTNEIYEKLILEWSTEQVIDENTFAEKLNEEIKNIYYQVLELDLPDNVTEEELEFLLFGLKKEFLKERIEQLDSESQQAKKENNRTKELELSQQIFKLRQQLQGGKF